jgi:hypothetical protein
MWTAQMGNASQYVGSQLSVRAPAAGVGRYASVEARQRRPLASHAASSKVAAPPRRRRISSSAQRARPIPGTDRGVESSTLTRRRVVMAVGCPMSAAWAWRRHHRRSCQKKQSGQGALGPSRSPDCLSRLQRKQTRESRPEKTSTTTRQLSWDALFRGGRLGTWPKTNFRVLGTFENSTGRRKGSSRPFPQSRRHRHPGFCQQRRPFPVLRVDRRATAA